MTTVFIATDTCDHFELAPQELFPVQVPLPQLLVLPAPQQQPLASSVIDPDLSWTMRMSGGSGMTGTCCSRRRLMPPVPGPTSPPPPEVRPIPVPPPFTPPAPVPVPVPFPELAAPPLSGLTGRARIESATDHRGDQNGFDDLPLQPTHRVTSEVGG